MSVVVGTLTIDLAARTSSFSQSMDRMAALSAKTANDVKRSLEKIAAAGLAMGTAVATGTAALIAKSTEAIVSLQHLSQAAGTTVETMSLLSRAAGRVGIPTEQLGKGLEKLARSSFLAQNGNQQLTNIFGRLGVTVKDSSGHLKDSGVLFSEIATKFSGMADGAGKTALAMALFGKAGAQMIPLLKDWGEHQKELTERYKQFGLVINSTVANAAVKFHETLGGLKSVVAGFGLQLTAATLPALTVLAQRLAEIAVKANIPHLAEVFGAKVVSAVTALSNAVQFLVDHAHAAKIALEALAAIQFGKIAIPVIADLAGGGFGRVGAGISKFVIGGLGVQRLIPIFTQLASWLKTEAFMVASLSSEEGLASAASYGLGTAITAIGGPVTIAIAAIAGLGFALYKFRDTVFQFEGSSYELRDTWNAVWLEMGWGIDWLAKKFGPFVDWMKSIWSDFANWLGVTLNKVVSSAADAISPILGAGVRLLIPNFKEALDAAKRAREAAAKGTSATALPPPARSLPQPETGGLGSQKKDVYGEEIAKLDQAVSAQRAYLGVLDATPEKIAAVAAAEKAQSIILELNNKLVDSQRPKLTASQEAEIGRRVALEESLKALNDYGKELVGQQHSADLATKQARALTAAMLDGDEAVRLAVVDNSILGLTYNKTAEQLKAMTPELAKLRTLMLAKSNTDQVDTVTKEIVGLRDELAARRLVAAATTQYVGVLRQAQLAAKLYALDQRIADTTDGDSLAALKQKRQLIMDITKAEWDETDARESLSLRSPIEQYQEEINTLNRETEALKKGEGGTLSYGQSLTISAKAQDAFNKLTDQTIALLTRFGGLRDGVTAFFLDMQKQAKSSAGIIYEALHSAFDKLADNLAQLITGGKTNFAKMFEDVGRQMVNSTIKQGLQTGLGALGKKMGINLGGALAGKPDGSSEASALWVRMAAKGGLKLPGAGGTADGSDAGTADDASSGIASKLGGLLGGIGSKLGGLFGSGSAGGGIFSFLGGLIPHADGGPVSPSMAYLVGERGPEILTGASGYIASNAASRRIMSGGGGDVHYHVDARGADIGVVGRLNQAMDQVHHSAVRTATAVAREHSLRTPHPSK